MEWHCCIHRLKYNSDELTNNEKVVVIWEYFFLKKNCTSCTNCTRTILPEVDKQS